MELTQGGRATLRLAASEADAVEYEGVLETAAERWPVRARVALADGAIAFTPGGAAAPEWLVEVARTTLRTAWRARRSGAPWPRRVSRWRDDAGGDE